MLTIKYLYIFEYQQVGDPKINLGTILKASKRGNITPSTMVIKYWYLYRMFMILEQEDIQSPCSFGAWEWDLDRNGKFVNGF
jgi:hypothetical protein